MEVTHQADYALRTILYLAQQGTGQRVPTSKIAADNQIPPSFLTKIVSQLAIAGLIHTSRGAHGGVWLGRSPEEISVLNVLEAIDGPVVLNQCVENPNNCPFTKDCALHPFWQEACAVLVDKLRSTDFASLLEKSAQPA